MDAGILEGETRGSQARFRAAGDAATGNGTTGDGTTGEWGAMKRAGPEQSLREGGSRAAGDPGRQRSSRAVRVALLLLGAATLFAYWPVLELEHMGWDTYPMIAASRIESFSDFAATFGEELMEGRYPGGHFYRPVANLSLALDWGLWGDSAGGYHLTDLLILLTQMLLTFALARTLLGGAAGAVVAAAVVGLHPLQLEILPVSARRADALSTLFIVATLWLQLRSSSSGPRRRSALVACAAVLAVGSKETGAIALPLALVASLLLSSDDRPHRSALELLRSFGLPAVALLLFLLLRAVVLGGIGGHESGSGGASWSAPPIFHFGAVLLVPQPLVASPIANLWLAACTGLLGAALALSCLESGAREQGRAGAADRRALLLVGLAWVVALSLLTGLSGRVEPWYASPFLPPYALVLGLLVNLAIGASTRPPRAVGVLAAFATVALLSSHLRFSPLLVSYPEWSALSDREERFLADFRLQLAELEPGMAAVVRGLPVWQPPLGPVGIRGAAGLAGYSVQAYADLLDLGVPITVEESPGTRVPVARPGALRIEVVAETLP